MKCNILPLSGCKRTKHSQIPNTFRLQFPQNMIIINQAGKFVSKSRKENKNMSTLLLKQNNNIIKREFNDTKATTLRDIRTIKVIQHI